ncbi:MAG TPA: alanine--tRNA ligase [Dissulfurispiraceae bacterium]|nr:alanine--tRNA ligase [Dissulfurispiraceae bacterium]
MKGSEIRNMFLDFFKSKGHEAIRSSSLIPRNDPTLLFTNAGMVQFKTVFLGEEKRPYTRATTSQKCMRAGGKHSDLENVGHTARHHTFFEMLGNFSFGDYFKRDAIIYAWELLTERFKLPKDKLWVTVYQDDDEAAGLWPELTGISPDRIVRLGAKDNFWQMGDTGPCGPCSEIIIDQGEEVGCGGPDCKVGCDCDRFLELWNLVFMQFNRDESGALTPLPKPSIDTGMGLERIAAVLQGKHNNFDTDLFVPIISAISAMSGTAYGKSAESDISIRVIADHLRAVSFLLADGLMPSNDGRGYVLRRIIRRAARHAKLLGFAEPVLFKLMGSVADAMGDVYTELVQERERSSKVLLFEEERFTRTLDQGMRLLDDIIAKLKQSGGKMITGEELFKLYDTFGFPLDLARDMAMDNHLHIDEDGFSREMQLQRERARASWVGEEDAVASIYRELVSEIGETVFAGYDSLETESVVKAILRDGKVVTEATAGDEVELFLDRTPFYGESGGQVGDKGIIFNGTAEFEVKDTKKEAGLNAHIAVIHSGSLKVWDKVKCVVDKGARMAVARNHTATHILHAALRSVLGEHVKQAGSYVSAERLRFDFSHFYQVDKSELDAIEDIVNAEILENKPVHTETSDIQAALKSGVTALFGEKYGETVRVVKVPGFSAELCGGTHCRTTGDVGLFTVVSEGSVASGIRRIEAFTGKAAYDYLRLRRDELKQIGDILKSDKPVERIEKIVSDMKDREKEVEALKGKLSSHSSSSLLDLVREVGGVKVLSCRVDNLEQKDLRVLADNVRDRLGSGIIVIASAKDGQASIVAMVTKDLTKQFSAGEILKNMATVAGGRGGGKPDMAQGGTKELDKLDSALEYVYALVKNK